MNVAMVHGVPFSLIEVANGKLLIEPFFFVMSL